MQRPQRTNAEWTIVLKHADIPCGPVNSFEDLFANQQLESVKMFQPVEHPSEGSLTSVRSPFKVTNISANSGSPGAEGRRWGKCGLAGGRLYPI